MCPRQDRRFAGQRSPMIGLLVKIPLQERQLESYLGHILRGEAPVEGAASSTLWREDLKRMKCF